MKIVIRSIIVNFRDPAYQARLEISDILIQSTTPEWNPATLSHTRYKNETEESVIIYKMCNIGNMKLEGWIVDSVRREGEEEEDGGRDGEREEGERGGRREGGMEGDRDGGRDGEREGGKSEGEKESDKKKLEDSKVKLRLIAGETNIRFTLKRHIEDCSILHTRVVVRLGDVMWILSRSQLQAVSRLIQTLITAAVIVAQKQRQVHTHIHTHTHTHTQPQTQTHTHKHTHKHKLTHTNTHTNTNSHTHTQTRTHTHKLTHTHTHKLVFLSFVVEFVFITVEFL